MGLFSLQHPWAFHTKILFVCFDEMANVFSQKYSPCYIAKVKHVLSENMVLPPPQMCSFSTAVY
jgi:hypothetical protein